MVLISVSRICVREVDLAAVAESAYAAACLMADHEVGALIVLDDAKRRNGCCGRTKGGE